MNQDRGITIDVELDKIVEQLSGLEGEKVTKAKELYYKIRELSEGDNASYLLSHYLTELQQCVTSLAAMVMMMSENGGVDFESSPFGTVEAKSDQSFEEIEQLYHAIKEKVEGHTSVKGDELTVEEKALLVQRYQKDLKSLDSSLNSNSNLERVQAELIRIKGDMEESQIHNDSFSAQLKDYEYRLIADYILAGEDEKAREYIKTLGRKAVVSETVKKPFRKTQMVEYEVEVEEDIDMRRYLKEKIRSLMKEKVLDADPTAFTSLKNYRRQRVLDLDDMNLWKTIVAVETGRKLDIVKEVPKEEPKKKEKTPIPKYKKREPKEDDKEYEVITIKYDKRAPGGISKRDLKKIEKLRENEAKKNQKPIRIVFEEGITKIPQIGSSSSSSKAQYVESIEFPSTTKALAAGAFRFLESLKSVDLSQTQIEEIPVLAFAESSISKIQLPLTLKTVNESAFQYTKDLKSIDLSHTQIETIGRFAFLNSGISEVQLPSTLKNMGVGAFEATKDLKSIDLSHTKLETISKEAFDGSGITEIQLPSTLKTVDETAFRETKDLKSIDLSHTQLEVMGGSAFANSGISQIQLPPTLNKIYSYAFWGTKNLKKIDLSHTQLETIGHSAFGDSAISEIQLPSTLRIIGESAFKSTKDLKSIDLSHTQLEVIGQSAFANSGISQIQLPPTVKTVDVGAFYQTKSLKRIDLSHTQVEKIGNQAFYQSNIEEIMFPSTLEELGRGTFGETLSLSTIDLSSTRVETIPEEAFQKSAIQTIHFPPCLERIEEKAFAKTKQLEQADLSQTHLYVVEREAFRESGIKEINMPPLLERIGMQAFCGTEYLKELELSQTHLTEIEGYAFEGSSISHITLPNTLKRMSAGAFRGTSSLTELDLHTTQLDCLDREMFCNSGIKKLILPPTIQSFYERDYYYLDPLDGVGEIMIITPSLPVKNVVMYYKEKRKGYYRNPYTEVDKTRITIELDESLQEGKAPKEQERQGDKPTPDDGFGDI